MAKEHKDLANIIKNVHLKLRISAQKYGPEKAWCMHLQNEQKSMEIYAKSMEELNIIWEENSKDQTKEAHSRIDWISNFCADYFLNDTIIQFHREKELSIYQNNEMGTLINTEFLIVPNNKIKLLDVGSCYNPFFSLELFDEIAIDIAPSNKCVYKCDFLNVTFGETIIYSDNNKITVLPKQYFDVAVFSLLLEYVPSSEQRVELCKNAYGVLKYEGLLIIITPDSKHVGMNAKLMKTWRYTLGLLGFSRIKFEKLSHITCMVFRKGLYPNVCERWSKLHKETFMTYAINIPQDFNLSKNGKINDDCSELYHDDDDVKSLFFELPDFIDDENL